MPDPERVIAALPCLAAVLHDCLKCPYNPHPGMNWPYGCIKGQGDIVQDAIELIRQQGQRRRGYWIRVPDYPGDEDNPAWDCSECAAMCAKQHDYCPACGAIMDKEDEPSEKY